MSLAFSCQNIGFYGGRIEGYQFTSVAVLSGYIISEALSGTGGNQNYHIRHYMLLVLFFIFDWSFIII